MEKDMAIRDHLVKMMKGGNAFMPLYKIVADIPFDKLGEKPQTLPYTLWQQIEHIRISQKDILEFSKGDNYKKLKWPEEYWPEKTAPEDKEEWEKCLSQLKNDMQEMIRLVEDKDNALLEPFDHGKGQTLLREACLIAEHNAYHTGQVVIMRRLLNIWKK